MKTSEVLRRVRLHLGSGGTMPAHKRYVCFALRWLYQKAKVISDSDRARVQKLIYWHLDRCNTLEHWLQENHGIGYDFSPSYRRKIMATRKAWLTHLIEHYSHKGD